MAGASPPIADLLPREFRLNGTHCGIKASGDKHDLALIVSDRPATAVGVFTTNQVFAAPVQLTRERTPTGQARGVIINSGNANACTGPRGLDDARRMATLLAERHQCAPDDILVLSTGVIGQFLPMDRIAAGISALYPRLESSPAAVLAAARGMLTTDTHEKWSGRHWQQEGETVRLLGMCKGAAMIGPNMATMLAVLITDASLTPAQAHSILRSAVDDSFNCISVEGHTSTNDTVLLLANGAAGRPVSEEDLGPIRSHIRDVCQELALSIVADGEGATHLITIDVNDCQDRLSARQIARSIANSPLVKTAMAGGDPNWGRILSAAGYSGASFDPQQATLHLNGYKLFERGMPTTFQPADVSQSIRSQRNVHVQLDVGTGSDSVRFWTCDLTAEYVRLNADYFT